MRQRQHRRQNSTPTAFEAVKIAPLPKFHNQQQHRPHQMSHRRGLSLDTHRQQLSPTRARTTIRQDYTTVSTSTTNNTGLSTTQQHVLREAQQQRIARPGPGQPTNAFANDDDESFLLSPHQTPHSQRFVDAMAAQGHIQDMGIPRDPYLGHVNGTVKNSRANFGHSRNHSMNSNADQDLEFFAADSALSTPSFVNFPESSPLGSQQGWISEGEAGNTQRRRTSRRISNGIMDRVAKFENIGHGMEPQRPVTPPHQNVNSKSREPNSLPLGYS
jgi:regulatory protein SWI5